MKPGSQIGFMESQVVPELLHQMCTPKTHDLTAIELLCTFLKVNCTWEPRAVLSAFLSAVGQYPLGAAHVPSLFPITQEEWVLLVILGSLDTFLLLQAKTVHTETSNEVSLLFGAVLRTRRSPLSLQLSTELRHVEGGASADSGSTWHQRSWLEKYMPLRSVVLGWQGETSRPAMVGLELELEAGACDCWRQLDALCDVEASCP